MVRRSLHKIVSVLLVVVLLGGMAPGAIARVPDPQEDVQVTKQAAVAAPQSASCSAVLVAGKSSGTTQGDVVLPDGIKAKPLSEQTLKEVLKKVLESPDGQTMASLLEKEGYSLQEKRAMGYLFTTDDNKEIIGLAVPLSGSGEGWFVAADTGSSIIVAGGTAHLEDKTRVIDLYDVRGGKLTNHTVIEQHPDGTLLNRATGQAATQSSGNCNLCMFVCGLIKGTGCSLIGVPLCLFVSSACGPDAPICWLMCMAMWVIVCNNITTPCSQVCRNLGYCP